MFSVAFTVITLCSIFITEGFAGSIRCNIQNEGFQNEGYCISFFDCRDFKTNMSSVKIKMILLNYKSCQNLPKPVKYCCTHDLNQTMEETTTAQSSTKAPKAGPLSTTEIKNVPSSTERTKTIPSSMTEIKDHPSYQIFNDIKCGTFTSSRIANGNLTRINEFPWHALLNYKMRDGTENFLCGGSLISEKYILTAAHCLINLPNNEELVSVRLGEHQIKTLNDCEEVAEDEVDCAAPVQDILVEEIITHNNYNKGSSYGNDIALLRLAAPARREGNVSTICLPFSTDLLEMPARLTVIGFGKTEKNIASTVLLKAQLPYVSNKKCISQFTSYIKLTSKQFCAGGIKKIDSCSGDSGGSIFDLQPLSKKSVPKAVQFGIVSFGIYSCGVESLPGIYTKVYEYLGWIVANIKP